MKIGLLLIATGNYHQFVQSLLESVKEFFFKGFMVNVYLFTDNDKSYELDDRVTLTRFKIKHEPFPGTTLNRYKYFTLMNEELNSNYLFYLDVDMLIVDYINIEILPESLLAVTHPGFYDKSPNEFTFESRVESTAYCKGKNYFAGGFNGGTQAEFLNMSEELYECIEKDKKNDIVALWHDESHLNRYMNQRKPMILDPGYCYPENWDIPFDKKILALDKNHAKLRNFP